ncbi:hypothetical protein EDB85DRAFT_1896816 [Lactarius pseudohatsudake]|nr:hypothetical protein EDB85DRAFT_1896816 [Lactarius pseudohatsudake]
MPPKSKPRSQKNQKLPATELGDGRDGAEFGGFQKSELREKKKAAELGYLSMDIVDPPKGAFWGKFNDRKVDEQWVNKLVTSFTENLENCTDVTAIEVAVKKTWVKNLDSVMPTVDMHQLSEVPDIEFTDEGKEAIARGNLWMLGGNHRRKALTKYRKMKSEELKTMKNQVGKMETEALADEELDTAKAEVKRLEETVAASSIWVIRLYDREENPNKLATAIYRFMSRNETKENRMTTDEELLLEIVDELKDAYEADIDMQREQPNLDKDLDASYPAFMKLAKDKAEKAEESKETPAHRRLCSVPAFARGLVMASRVRRHYTHAPWFEIGTLSKMLDSHGALISEFLIESIEVLERLANPNAPPLDKRIIDGVAIDLMESRYPAGLDEANKKLSDMTDAFKGRGDASSWNEELLAKIDECFVRNYKDKDDPAASFCDSLFFPDSDNHNRFTKYQLDVDKVLQEESHVAPRYAREYFSYYALIWQLKGRSFPVPLGTASVIDAVHQLATKYRRGLSEYSDVVQAVSWIGTCVSWAPKMSAKFYVIIDPFDSALTAATSDILLKPNEIGVRRKMDAHLLEHVNARGLVKDLAAFKSIVGGDKEGISKSSKSHRSRASLPVSQKRRDWAVTALAVTAESAVVEQYRRRLLDMCPSARRLRRDLQSLFVDLAVPFRVDRPGANKPDFLREWQFADDLKIPDSEVPVVHNLKDFLEPWQRACSTLAKDVKDPVLALIQSMEKSRYLACSDPKAPPGAIETLAHKLISALAEIMYKNKARIEHTTHHAASDSDDASCDRPFHMAGVTIPPIPRKPHAVSEEYRTESSLAPSLPTGVQCPPLHQPSSGPRDLSTPPPGQGPPTRTWPPSESPGDPLADDQVNFPDSPIHPASSLSNNLDDDRIVDPPSRSLPRVLPKHPAPSSPESRPPAKRQARSKAQQSQPLDSRSSRDYPGPSTQSKKPSKPRSKPGSSKLTPLPDDVYQAAF